MALVKVKVRKDFVADETDYIEGAEVVMQRKVAQGYVAEELVDIVSAPLDPNNPEDKPLIDAWMEVHQPAPVEAPEEIAEEVAETTEEVETTE